MAILQSNEWPQKRASAHDFNTIKGRAKAHKLWVLLELIPSTEEVHLQTATEPSPTPHPKRPHSLSFHPKWKAALPEMSRECTLSFLNQTATAKTHSVQQRGGHSPAVAGIWHEDKLTLHSPQPPVWCRALLFQLKKGLWLSSWSSSVKCTPITSRTALTRAYQESLLSYWRGNPDPRPGGAGCSSSIRGRGSWQSSLESC